VAAPARAAPAASLGVAIRGCSVPAAAWRSGGKWGTAPAARGHGGEDTSATLLLPSASLLAQARGQGRRRGAAQLLRLVRRYGRLLAAGAVASRLGPRRTGAFLHTHRQEMELFLRHLEEAGLSPSQRGRALALLEWEAERQAASWEEKWA